MPRRKRSFVPPPAAVPMFMLLVFSSSRLASFIPIPLAEQRSHKCTKRLCCLYFSIVTSASVMVFGLIIASIDINRYNFGLYFSLVATVTLILSVSVCLTTTPTSEQLQQVRNASQLLIRNRSVGGQRSAEDGNPTGPYGGGRYPSPSSHHPPRNKLIRMGSVPPQNSPEDSPPQKHRLNRILLLPRVSDTATNQVDRPQSANNNTPPDGTSRETGRVEDQTKDKMGFEIAGTSGDKEHRELSDSHTAQNRSNQNPTSTASTSLVSSDRSSTNGFTSPPSLPCPAQDVSQKTKVSPTQASETGSKHLRRHHSNEPDNASRRHSKPYLTQTHSVRPFTNLVETEINSISMEESYRGSAENRHSNASTDYDIMPAVQDAKKISRELFLSANDQSAKNETDHQNHQPIIDDVIFIDVG